MLSLYFLAIAVSARVNSTQNIEAENRVPFRQQCGAVREYSASKPFLTIVCFRADPRSISTCFMPTMQS